MLRIKYIHRYLVILIILLMAGSVGADWQQQQKLTASDANQYDSFGYSVSIDGDYAVIGACYSDVGGLYDNRGAAYIFKRSGTTWTQQDKLSASDAQPGDYFGYSVSISGDYVIVSAYAKNSYIGAAYIFKRNGTSWSQQAKLTASDGISGDEFGYCVSISGDYAIVGAYNDSDFGVNFCGSVYVFEKPPTGWEDATETTKLFAFDFGPIPSERFGYSVAIDANTVIVGATHNSHSPSLNWAGAAYVFKREGTYWNPQPPKLTASDASAGDEFGWSVAINANYAVVGAPWDDIDAVRGQTGCAYIFKCVGGPVWIEQDILFASSPSASDYFGWSVSISGDYALVGAMDHLKPSVFRRARIGTTWPLLDILTIPDVNSTDAFGGSVSIDGDYAIIGAHTDDGHGAAYTFKHICPTADLTNDCCVDYSDLKDFSSYWLSAGPADWDGSGTVDFPDLAKLALQWLHFN